MESIWPSPSRPRRPWAAVAGRTLRAPAAAAGTGEHLLREQHQQRQRQQQRRSLEQQHRRADLHVGRGASCSPGRSSSSARATAGSGKSSASTSTVWCRTPRRKTCASSTRALRGSRPTPTATRDRQLVREEPPAPDHLALSKLGERCRQWPQGRHLHRAAEDGVPASDGRRPLVHHQALRWDDARRGAEVRRDGQVAGRARSPQRSQGPGVVDDPLQQQLGAGHHLRLGEQGDVRPHGPDRHEDVEHVDQADLVLGAHDDDALRRSQRARRAA